MIRCTGCGYTDTRVVADECPRHHITAAERRWHWRTWNLLLQIRQATDGEDARQRYGDMTERNLLVAHTPELRALHNRGWVAQVDTGELARDNGHAAVTLPAWAITQSGRAALVYTCPTCKGETVTIDVDDGTTPLMLGCRVTPGCTGMAESSFCRPSPDHGPPMFEWYKPSAKEVRKSEPGMRQHAEMGGLFIRARQ